MRDKLNPQSCINLIKEVEELIPSTLEDINNQTDPVKKKQLQTFHFANLLEKTIAHYSVGDDKETVCQALRETIPAFEEGFHFDDGYMDYNNMIWMISLAILCDLPLEEFKRITAILARDGANDRLLSELIRYKQPDWPQSDAPVIQKHPYAQAVHLHTAQDIKHYLDKVWYRGHSDAYWHGLHKNKKVNNYFGYWAWVAGALAKVRGIDDTGLENQKYYPYDAVHW